jgi:hypothetical protein
MSEKEKTTRILIDAALKKINRIRAGNAFVGDFEAARLLESLLLELKISQALVEKQKKLVNYYKLYISRRLEKEIKED